MARHDNALQGVMLVALLILFPMTIQLLVHQDESPLWKTVYVEVESDDDDDDAEARSESRDRVDVARIATFNIKIFGETKMGKADVVSELVNITLRYDMVVVQEIKDLDQTVPYDFLDAINAESNETYGLVLSERSGQQEDDQGGQEQYAFYYRTSRFNVESAWLHNDSQLDEFQREPFISTFQLLSDNGTVLENLTSSQYIQNQQMQSMKPQHCTMLLKPTKQIQPNPISSFLETSMPIAVMLQPTN